MLEEIRVKMMTRIAKLREFTNTWRCNFSPMALKVLEENIDRSMNCTIEFNGVAGFEVREGLCQHTVDLGRGTCSCRVWQLKGIPCAHVVAALYFKKYDPVDYIDSCYSKETYLRTYANVLQPVTNMEIWPISNNPRVVPPEIKSMPGRPGKMRRKEAAEIKKSGKLPRTGLAMTCSNCNARGYNKRGCPQSVESREESSNTGRERDQPSGSGRGKGRPKKPTTEGEPPAKRGRGRPRKTTAVPSASPPPTVPPAYSAPSATPPPTATRAHPPPIAPIDYPISSSAPPDFVSSLPSTSKRGRGKGMERGRGSTTTYKRPPIMGMGIF